MRRALARAMPSAALLAAGASPGPDKALASVSRACPPNGLSAMLLGFGVANFVGTSLSGLLLQRSLRMTLLLMPLAMGGIGLVLAATGTLPWIAAVLVALWGMAFGAVPVAWSTWLTRVVPDEAESGGGLIVAAVQLAITVGAAAGGVVFDAGGAHGVFAASAMLLLGAALVVFRGFWRRPVLAAAPLAR